MNKQDLYLQKLHGEILTIMDEIDRICCENNIRYYLIGGTLLGAIRHKGFIPWDDDLDIVMPREEMNKFIEIAPSKLKKEFQLEWFSTNKNYYQFFPKVSLKGTLFMQDDLKERCQSGVFVDIFPLDLSPAYSEWLNNKKKWIRRYSGLITSRQIKHTDIRTLILCLVGRIIGKSRLFKLLNQSFQEVKQRGISHYANFGSQYSMKKQTMPVEWFGEGVYLPFEDRQYVCPSEYTNVVKSIFGEKYMQIPSVEKRRCHYPSKVVFSDGTEMAFSKPVNKVTVKDQI